MFVAGLQDERNWKLNYEMGNMEIRNWIGGQNKTQNFVCIRLLKIKIICTSASLSLIIKYLYRFHYRSFAVQVQLQLTTLFNYIYNALQLYLQSGFWNSRPSICYCNCDNIMVNFYTIKTVQLQKV